MKKVLLVAALAATLPGCAAWQKVQPVLSDVEAKITDASALIDAIQSVVTVFFLARPAPEVQAKVEKAIGDVSLGLSAASRALRGVENASQEQLDAAWKDFRGSYAELLVILRDIGIVSADGKMATRRGTVALPDPLAMGHQ
jgi:hypothetical protein